MNSFESIIKTIFESKGYWVQTSYKVHLSKEQKRQIGRPSSPRWEIDVIAYKGGRRELLAIECKSYLDSTGVKAGALKGGRYRERYKLFTEERLREVILGNLLDQLVTSGACAPDTEVKLCLATGKIATEADRVELREYFEQMDWGLFDDAWVREELIRLSELGYENNVAMVATKILMRGND